MGKAVVASVNETERCRSAILAVVRAIPPGAVASYGWVAAQAGLPGRARLVGRVLGGLPADSGVPWHRVMRAGGRLAFPADSADAARQRRALEAEGVSLRGGRVPTAVLVGAATLDRLLWGPQPSTTTDSRPPQRRRR